MASPEPAAAREPKKRRGEGPTEAPLERWAVELGAVIYARPTLAEDPGGRVVAYVGTHAGRFVGVVVDGPDAGQVALEVWVDGIIWSTAVADARGWLYFGADDDTLYAIDPAAGAGAIAWRRRLGECEPTRAPGPEGVRCDVDGGPSLGPAGDLYVGADGLYRVGSDGELRWRYPRDSESAAHVATIPLVTDEGVVYGDYARTVTALDHEGALRWELKLGADVDGSPVAGPDGQIYVGSDDGSLHAISSEGAVLWSYEVGAEVRGQPIVGPDGAVVFGSYDGNLYALEPEGGLRWVMPTGGAIHAPPTLDSAGRIYVGSRDEHLYSIDIGGQVGFRLALPDQIDSGVAISPEGTLVVGCDDGVLRALR